jgi:hypothetical protein
MSKKMIITALGTIVAMGITSQNVSANSNTQILPKKTSRRTLTKELPSSDLVATNESYATEVTTNSAKKAWLGSPIGTCDKIVDA